MIINILQASICMKTKVQKFLKPLPKIVIKLIEYGIVCYVFFMFLHLILIFRTAKVNYANEKSYVIKNYKNELVLVLVNSGEIGRVLFVDILDDNMNLLKEACCKNTISYPNALILEISEYPNLESFKIKIVFMEKFEVLVSLKNDSTNKIHIADTKIFKRDKKGKLYEQKDEQH